MPIEIIPLERLLLIFIPTIAIVWLMYRWGLPYRKASYAIVRMLVQLMLIGYALVMIFGSESSLLVLGVLLIMVLASSWISLNTLIDDHPLMGGRSSLYPLALISIGIGGGLTLILVTQLVLRLDPWYYPRYMVPLAGMIFATAMTSISLAAERLQSELQQGASYDEGRTAAYRTALIPIVNSMFAVGLVSLPGMMTGQILSGVSPFIAARYQIMVMGMLFCASGISSAIFLMLLKKRVQPPVSS